MRESLRLIAAHSHPLLPRLQQYLTEVGENLCLARLRQRLSAGQVAERAAINRVTLAASERGAPSVSLGNYLQVLLTLGLEKSILHLAPVQAHFFAFPQEQLLAAGQAQGAVGTQRSTVD